MADPDVDKPAPTPMKQFAGYLGQYRDVIVLLVFFLGGFIWLDRTFPKNEDLARLECLLNSYMQLTQLQTNTINVENALGEALDLVKLASLSPAMRLDKEDQIARLRVQAVANQQKISGIRQALERHECNG